MIMTLFGRCFPECKISNSPDLGLRCLHEGDLFPGRGITSPLGSSRKHLSSSSRSVLSSAADSLPDCSGEVTFTSTLSSDGCGRADCSASDTDEGQERGGGLWDSGSAVVALPAVAEGGSTLLSSGCPSPDASFCF